MTVRVIQIAYHEVGQAAATCVQQAEGIDNLLGLATTCVNQLQTGGWVGAGAQAFFREMGELVFPGLKRLHSALQQTGRDFQRISRLMRAAEEEAARLFAYEPAVVTAKASDGAVGGPGNNPDGTLEDYSRVKLKPVRHYKLYVKGEGEGRAIHPSDANQGGIGDCYLVASMAALALKYPELIEKAIQDNGDGTFTVTLYDPYTVPPKPHTFIVKPEFPKGKHESGLPPHIEFGDKERKGLVSKKEIWPQILEQAYAQLAAERIGKEGDILAGYQKISEGDQPETALTALTGQTGDYQNAKHNLSFDQFIEMADKGFIFTLSTWTKEEISMEAIKNGEMDLSLYGQDKLTYRHAYYVTDIDRTTQMVTVRNPHDWNMGEIKIPFKEMFKHFRTLSFNPVTEENSKLKVPTSALP